MVFCTKIPGENLLLLVKMMKTRRAGPARRVKNANWTYLRTSNPQKRKEKKERKERNQSSNVLAQQVGQMPVISISLSSAER